MVASSRRAHSFVQRRSEGAAQKEYDRGFNDAWRIVDDRRLMT